MSGTTDLAFDTGPCSGMQTMQAEAGTLFHLYRKESLISLKCLLCSTNTEVICVTINSDKSETFSAKSSGEILHFETDFYIIVTGFWCLTCTYRASRRPDGSWMVRTPQGACRSLYPQLAWTPSLYSLTAVATSIGQSLQSGEKQKVSKT